MIKPVRIQRKRTRGYNMQAESKAANGLDCVYVGRPGKWGNPHKAGSCIYYCRNNIEAKMWYGTMINNIEDGFVRIYDAEHLKKENIKKELKGKNLACFCALDQPCHADILLEIANGS